MAKKEGKDWKGALMDALKGQVLGKIKDYFDDFVDKVQDAIIVTQKKVIRALSSLALMILGLIFLVLGGTFYLTDVLKFDRSTVYLVIGVILILISVILAQSARLLKYDFNKKR